jgi:N-acetyltransferase
MKIEPVTLEGRHVRLEPLSESHHAALCEVGLDAELWKYFPWGIHSPDEMLQYVREREESLAKGVELAFATIEKNSGRVVGSTRFMNVDVQHKRVEIGGTFIARPWQRTAINTEAKYLMLRYAFEVWECNRVELKTDALNLQSRTAILRIGAKEEGTLRSHMITWTGRVRDTVYFSITAPEWPSVKIRLEEKMKSR